MDNRIKAGCVARCKAGKLGVVMLTLKRISDDKPYKASGISFDGTPWQSVDPDFIAPSVDSYIWNVIDHREGHTY